jgi:hypothetical protein
MTWKALTVEIIRLLWDKGLYKQNKLLQQIHENWFKFWVEWKTELTMRDVDKQIEEMFLEPEVDPPVFSEELEGETPLGGKLELRAPWLDEDDNP